MSKISKKKEVFFECSECGYVTKKWVGRCPQCNNWNTFREIVKENKTRVKRNHIEIKPLSQQKMEGKKRFSTGIDELDRVLGGGVVKGSVVLIGGEPGIGKSTILLQAAENLSINKKVLYVSAEESISQIKMRAERLGLKGNELLIVSETSAESVVGILKQEKIDILIIDSIQTVFSEQISSAPGSVVQVREITSKLVEISKTKNISTFIVGHITKSGSIAGPKMLEHLVDTVLYFEGDRFHQGRILRAIKNRYGPAFEIGLFEITSQGLIPLKDPFNLWEDKDRERESGIAIFPAIEGSRPILVEIQSLVSPSPFMGNPRRMFLGVDRSRATMLIGVIEKRVGIKFYEDDIFIKISGGLYIQDPAIDLAIAASLISSKTGKKIDKNTIFVGEISLAGRVRFPYMINARIKEAKKFGMKELFTSDIEREIEGLKDININKIRYINQLRKFFN